MIDFTRLHLLLRELKIAREEAEAAREAAQAACRRSATAVRVAIGAREAIERFVSASLTRT